VETQIEWTATALHGCRSLTELGQPEGKKEEGHMKTIRFLIFRVFLLIAFITSCFYFLYGQEREHGVPIVRNVAWNDLVTQIKYVPDDSPQECLFKEVLVIQKFLSQHATEVSVTDYDIAVFKAIDQVRARLQKADKDLETIKKELSYREQEAKTGR
jgi:hypothetical protein